MFHYKEEPQINDKDRFLQAFGNISNSLAKDIPEYFMKQEEESKTNKAIKELTGTDISGLPHDFKKIFLEDALKQQGLDAKRKQELEDDENDSAFEDVKKEFGEPFAKVWKASDRGSQTELMKFALNSRKEGIDVNELLSGKFKGPQATLTEIPENFPQLQDGKLPKDVKWPEFSKKPIGYTNKDWNDEKKTWRKENAPVFDENKVKLKNNVTDALGTRNLTRLNETRKIPEGFSKFFINPETGEYYGAAKLTGKEPVEVQEWNKEIARFQNRAKDAFGSRVTNFDLVSYMKQFPSLMNTYEGRKRILELMTINTELDGLYNKALDSVYKKYGLGNIPQESADELAKAMIKDKTEELHNKYLRLEDSNDLAGTKNENQKLSGKLIDVIGPDGETYEIDESELNQLPQGYRRI